jgi:hypothetical protein
MSPEDFFGLGFWLSFQFVLFMSELSPAGN